MTRKTFKGLMTSSFLHIDDANAMADLQVQLSSLSTAARETIDRYENYMYARHMSSSLMVSKDQLPEINSLLVEACNILDVHRPLLFIVNSSDINAFTSGSQSPFICMTSGMIERFNEEELLAVIGHELGHVKAEHLFFQALANNAASILAEQVNSAARLSHATTGAISLISGLSASSAYSKYEAFEKAIIEWSRVKEFTADRCSLLVVQDDDVIVDVMMKLAAGINRKFDRSAFLNQADNFNHFGESKLEGFYKELVTESSGHPLLVIRAEAIKKWYKGDEYKNILAGNYAREINCIKCKSVISSKSKFCPDCGVEINIGREKKS